MRLSAGSVNVSDWREPDTRRGWTIEWSHQPHPRARQETPMLIAVLDLRTTAADRPVALAQLDSEREEIRAMPGNLDFRAYAARDDEEAVAVIHEWADKQSFAAYSSSE